MHNEFRYFFAHIVICSPGCSFDHGTCTVPNTCSCTTNQYIGENCTIASMLTGCEHGRCNNPDDWCL